MTPTPYWTDGTVTLYLGDCREVLPGLTEQPVACVADPPYGETIADWDVWPDGWVAAVGDVLPASASLWCFGSARMFLDRAYEFAGWKYGQEALWVKHNGSGPTSRDRLVRVHEWAYQWYRGRWTDLHHEWERERVTANRGTARKPARAAAHQREGRQNAWADDGTRQPRSVAHVIHAPSVRGKGRHPDEKPLAVVSALVRESTPPGALVLDPFAGSGTTLVAARLLGRRAIGIESDERFAEIIVQRLEQATLLDRDAQPAGTTTAVQAALLEEPA
ncbi:DNA-methyltransferase [Nonomuraea sp. NPDC051941]|uniref:DNA-methyltransferase n=1 Tax=Nonomuraea sp. NPDC051941 TaxID=3364373 RepID=UPI0037C6B138